MDKPFPIEGNFRVDNQSDLPPGRVETPLTYPRSQADYAHECLDPQNSDDLARKDTRTADDEKAHAKNKMSGGYASDESQSGQY